MIFFQKKQTKDFEDQLNSKIEETKEDAKFTSKTPDTGSADAKHKSQTVSNLGQKQ